MILVLRNNLKDYFDVYVSKCKYFLLVVFINARAKLTFALSYRIRKIRTLSRNNLKNYFD